MAVGDSMKKLSVIILLMLIGCTQEYEGQRELQFDGTQRFSDQRGCHETDVSHEDCVSSSREMQ